MKKNKSVKIFVIIVAIISALITYIQENPINVNSPYIHPEGELNVHFVDVGQADCQVILLPNNQTMVIDAGNNDDGDLIINYLENLNIEKIDYLVGTHPHEDHIGALDAVIENFDIGTVFMPDAEADSKSYRDVIKAISYKNLDLITTSGGHVIFSDNDLNIVTVAPVKNYDDLNNQSIVIRLTYKDSSFLFTGDAEEESENDITMDISADVLSVGHHGSSTSTSDYFLNRVDPMYAVISCGVNNDYGHPHRETIEKLENDDIVTYRTDTMGTVICTTHGNGAKDYYWEMSK